MTRSTARNENRVRYWIEGILLVAGIAGLGVWMGSNVVSTLWQAWANRDFDREISEQSATASRPSAVKDGSVVGRLTIPRLNMSAMVREGVGAKTLSLALGHVPSTAVPGEKGNVAVAGHRDTIFRSLRGIRKYDEIRFETPSSGSYVYQVSSIEIVDPTDVRVLQPSRDSELTLVTCYPFYYVGSAPERFIVKAREVDRVPANSKAQQISFR
jgi:sortase A